MAGFVRRLEEINALADASPGFVWRLQGDAGNATYLRPYGDDRIIFNLSVWESIEALRVYVYRTAHAEVLRQRRDWFEKFDLMHLALWWIPAGRLPTVGQATARLEYLQRHGEGPHAFTFRQIFPPGAEAAALPAELLRPCPA